MRIYIDGSGWNGKRSAYAYSITGETYPIDKVVTIKGQFTNNEMEYMALLIALSIAKEGDDILTDSQLLVGHIIKGWEVKAINLRTLFRLCKAIVKTKNIILTWIPRKENIAGKLLEQEKERKTRFG